MAQTRFTPKVRRALIEAFEQGLDIGQACTAAGISRAIFYRWLGRGAPAFASFRQRVDEAQAAAKQRADEELVAALKSPNAPPPRSAGASPEPGPLAFGLAGRPDGLSPSRGDEDEVRRGMHR